MRARAISMYLLVLQGGLAGGAALWGEIAELVGTPRSLTYAAIALLLGLACRRVVQAAFRRHSTQHRRNGLEFFYAVTFRAQIFARQFSVEASVKKEVMTGNSACWL